MKGFILAAGFGQRMLPITESLPKPLLPIGNLPLIAYAIKLLAHHGIVDIGVNLHYLGHALKEALGDGSQFGVRLTYSHEPEILGTGGGLKRMQQFIDATTVVVNSDTVVDIDLTAKIKQHAARGALATMVLRDDTRREGFGQIEIARNNGAIVRLVGQGPAPSQPVESFMFTGIHILEPRFLEYLPPDVFSCIIRYGYAKALSNHEPIFGTTIDTYWADAGTPERYLAVNQAALTRQMTLRHADPLGGFAHAPKQDVIDAVRMGHNVTLGASTQLRPPILLGDGARIGDKAVVGPGCVIGKHVHIGKGSTVEQCIVLDGARIEAGDKKRFMLIGKKACLTLKASAEQALG